MYRIASVIAMSLFMLGSCDQVKDKTRKTINKGGELAGKAGTEFGEGVARGVEQTLDLQLEVSQNLRDKGLEPGAYTVKSAAGGTDNVLSLYLIFNKDFSETVTIKAFNGKGQEKGRIAMLLEAKADHAGYYEISFDPNMSIAAKDKITIQ